MKIKFASRYGDHFAGAGKVIAGGKENVPKIELDAGGLLGEKNKTNHEYKKKVIDLLARVTTVSVETERITQAMQKAAR